MAEQTILDLYGQLSLWTNSICTQCKNSVELNGPISIWQVGEEYHNDRYRLVLIGKTARGGDEETDRTQLEQSGFIDWTDWANDAIQNKGWPYWSYTRAILDRLFGSVEDGWERIAFTNLVKCNNSSTSDSTTRATAENCLDKLQVTWKELEVLKPRNVIFYTGWWYDEFIERYTSQFDCHDLTNRKHTVENGAKRICWWERDCFENGILKFRLLRTSHPERQKKDPFVDRLTQWVRGYAP